MNITNIRTCYCGHAPEEHGHQPDHPGSTACTECECLAYEPDEDEDGGEDPEGW